MECYVINVIFTLKIEHKNILERGSVKVIVIIKKASLKKLSQLFTFNPSNILLAPVWSKYIR